MISVNNSYYLRWAVTLKSPEEAIYKNRKKERTGIFLVIGHLDGICRVSDHEGISFRVIKCSEIRL